MVVYLFDDLPTLGASAHIRLISAAYEEETKLL
jgi:hypothetical protein